MSHEPRAVSLCAVLYCTRRAAAGRYPAEKSDIHYFDATLDVNKISLI